MTDFNNPFSLLKAKPNNIDDPIINISPINEQKKLEEEQRARAEKSMKLKNFADTLRMVNANQSGNSQQSMMFANRLAQRKADQEARQKEAQALMKKEQFERDQEEFIKQNPHLAQAIELNRLFPGTTLPNNKLRFGNEDKLRDEHQKLSGTFLDVRDAYGRILSNAEEQTAASDLSLIFNYMKMLDPGSVVREGEFANAQNSAGVTDVVRAKYNSLLSGERLTENTRKDFIQTAQSLYKTQLSTQNNLDKNYRDLATSYDLDADKVVLDFNSPITKKEFKYNLSIMTDEDLASLDESKFTEEQIKEIDKEMDRRLK